eukprot:TRINITY_DN1208_c0_g2_i2.p1 TRINITY_DN1208_c0_g2~~TRINITY_DN1208_c0_g2_i2.p1  ORF type:complete len:210 (-),score=13.16 TRINITY_DN1208_c0_g2_i2:183-812(-)
MDETQPINGDNPMEVGLLQCRRKYGTVGWVCYVLFAVGSIGGNLGVLIHMMYFLGHPDCSTDVWNWLFAYLIITAVGVGITVILLLFLAMKQCRFRRRTIPNPVVGDDEPANYPVGINELGSNTGFSSCASVLILVGYLLCYFKLRHFVKTETLCENTEFFIFLAGYIKVFDYLYLVTACLLGASCLCCCCGACCLAIAGANRRRDEDN